MTSVMWTDNMCWPLIRTRSTFTIETSFELNYFIWVFGLQEVRVVYTVFCGKEIEDAELCERFACVGGALRYLLSTNAFNARVGAMKSDKKSLDYDKVMQILSRSPASQQVEQHRLLATKFLTCELQKGSDEMVDYKKSNIVFARFHALPILIYHINEPVFDEITKNNECKKESNFSARFEIQYCAQLQQGGRFTTKLLVGEKRQRRSTFGVV